MKAILILCFCILSAAVFGQDRQLPKKQLIYFDDAYYAVDRFEGDSIVLKVEKQITDHPDFKDMNPAKPEIRLRYFDVKDSTAFYALFAEQQLIHRSYADFRVSFDKITRLAKAKEIVITQAYLRGLRSDDYSGHEYIHPAFSAKLSIYDCHLDTLFWINLEFKDSVKCDNLVSSHCYIGGCTFDNYVHIGDVNSAHIPLPADFSSYRIFGSQFKRDFVLYRKSKSATMSFSRSRVYGSATMKNWGYDQDDSVIDTLPHFTLWNSEFEQLQIEEKIRGLEIEKVSVQKELSIENIPYREYKIYDINNGIKKLFFKQGALLTLTPDQDISETGIGLEALQNVTLNYTNPPWLFHNKDDFYVSVQQKIDKLKQYVNEFKAADKNQRDGVIDWLEYQAERYRREYYRNHLSEKGNMWKLCMSDFLEFVVRNGYHGEWVFFSRALFLIIFFMLIYVNFFRRTIDAYVTKEDFFDPHAHPSPRLKPKPPEIPTKISAGDYLLSMTRAIWFSFVIFVNPKFPNKYFKFHKSLLFVIIVEWSIGVFMLIIFAYFIASKFPFIKTLFGV